MTTYHLHAQMIGRGSGRSSVAAAAYRAAERIKNQRDGVTHDYTLRNAVSAAAYRSGQSINEHDFTNKRGVVYTEIMLTENAPKEFSDRAILWNAVEDAEKRCDAQTARELDIALPRVFSRDKQIEIMRKYVKDNFVDYGMIADFAVHDKGDGNPHAHIMLTTRDVDENGFGKKNRDWNKLEYLQKWRENWAKICNYEFERMGIDERIDHRTLAAQGISREATIHVGRSAERARQNAEIIKRNEAYIKDLRDGAELASKQVQELQAEKAAGEREVLRIDREIKDIAGRAEQIERLKNGSEHTYNQACRYFESVYKVKLNDTQGKIALLTAQAQNISEKLSKLDIKPYYDLAQVLEREYKINRPKAPQRTQERVRERVYRRGR